MINTAELVQKIEKELGSFFSTEAHPDVYRYIKSALIYIHNYRDWAFLKKPYTFDYTTPGEEVKIPVNMKTFYVLLGGTPENVLSREDFFLGSSGCCINQDSFMATGAGTYSILYMPSAPDVDRDTTTLDYPDNFFDAIQTLSVHFGHKDVRDYDTANKLLGFANAQLNSLADRNTNVAPRSRKARLGSTHNIF